MEDDGSEYGDEMGNTGMDGAGPGGVHLAKKKKKKKKEEEATSRV
jgi:hypothetical protein